MHRTLAAFALTLLFAATTHAATDIDALVDRMDQQMRGQTNTATMRMIVTTPRWTRTMVMESWSEGTEKFFIRILEPKKDAGVTFLRIGTQMWQYIPRIEKIIKIPPSMMLQGWMGSDFTNDDMVKESSFVEDYDKEVVSEDGPLVTARFTPRPNAAVVWTKLIMVIDTDTVLPKRVEYYDETDTLVRVLSYEDVTTLEDGRHYPTHWVMQPKLPDKEGHKTEVIVEETAFNVTLPGDIFTMQALRAYSR